MEKEKLNIFQKALKVQAEVKAIPKNGLNEFSNYHYIKESDVTEYIRELLVKHGICIIPSVEGVETWEREKGKYIRVKYLSQVINVDEPADRFTVIFYGDATDTLDKAIYKAIAGAEKYTLTKLFKIPGDDDPEKSNPLEKEDHKSDEPMSDKQLSFLKSLLMQFADKSRKAQVDVAVDFLEKYDKPASEEFMKFVNEKIFTQWNALYSGTEKAPEFQHWFRDIFTGGNEKYQIENPSPELTGKIDEIIKKAINKQTATESIEKLKANLGIANKK